MTLSLPKGMKDALPEDQIPINHIIHVLSQVFELYGFDPLDTPSIEMLDILTAKYAGGEEILKEIYTLTDRGQRALALRYDLTVPFARIFAMYKPQLPFKRYQIGKVWRDGPIGLGRYREFYQCDVDVIGTRNMLADAEFISLAAEVFRRLGIPVRIKVNNRKLLNGMVLAAGIPDDHASTAILILDKLEKIGADGVLAECIERGITANAAEKMLHLAATGGTNEEILAQLEKNAPNQLWIEGTNELREATRYADIMGVTDMCLDPSLARGLAYYTGTIFEVVALGSSITSSIAGGGRYDNMIGSFLEDGNQYPAVGISFGLSRIFDVIKERETTQSSVIKVYVLPFREQIPEAIKLTAFLRNAGINADFEKSGRNLKAGLKYVNTKHIPFTIFIGADEVIQGRYKLRNMNSGLEEFLRPEEIVQQLRLSHPA